MNRKRRKKQKQPLINRNVVTKFDKDILPFRKELLSLLEEWELYEILTKVGKSDGSGNRWLSWYCPTEPEEGNCTAIAKTISSEELRKLLSQKTRDKSFLNDLYRRYITANHQPEDTDDNEDKSIPKVPNNFSQLIYHLVHYFFHGALPLDEKLKSEQTLRKEEREVLGQLNIEEDFVLVNILEDQTIPRDVFLYILSYIPHDYEHLITVGLTSERFFISFLMSWDILKIRPKSIMKISLLAMKSAHHFVFIQEQTEEEKLSEIFTQQNFQYVFSQCSIQRIHTLDLSRLQNPPSYTNFFRSILKNRTIFPGLRKFIFCRPKNVEDDSSHSRNVGLGWGPNRLYDSRNVQPPDEEPCYQRKQEMSYLVSRNQQKIQNSKMNVFPRIEEVHDATIEDLLFFPRSVIQNRIHKMSLSLFKKDSTILNSSKLVVESVDDLSINPFEEMKTSYVHRVFEKINFGMSIRKLSIKVSSNKDKIEITHSSLNNLEVLILDFSGVSIDEKDEIELGLPTKMMKSSNGDFVPIPKLVFRNYHIVRSSANSFRFQWGTDGGNPVEKYSEDEHPSWFNTISCDHIKFEMKTDFFVGMYVRLDSKNDFFRILNFKESKVREFVVHSLNITFIPLKNQVWIRSSRSTRITNSEYYTIELLVNSMKKTPSMYGDHLDIFFRYDMNYIPEKYYKSNRSKLVSTLERIFGDLFNFKNISKESSAQIRSVECTMRLEKSKIEAYMKDVQHLKKKKKKKKKLTLVVRRRRKR